MRHATTGELRRLREMALAGMRAADAARQLGRTPRFVYGWSKRLGITFRGRERRIDRSPASPPLWLQPILAERAERRLRALLGQITAAMVEHDYVQEYFVR